MSTPLAQAARPSPSSVLDFRTEAGIRHAWLAHGPELRAFARRRLGDAGHAEDALQETFLRAWRSADRFDPTRGSARTWLYSIMSNLLIDAARARASRPVTTPIASDIAASEEVDALLTSLTLSSALGALSPEHREVIVHGYLKERPYVEIAARLGIPVGTVRSRLFYAREALSAALHRIGAVESSSREASAAA
jgi:RNA polymerase sigma-70 factor (ECF subfamily)